MSNLSRGRRVASLALAALVGLSLAGCIADGDLAAVSGAQKKSDRLADADIERLNGTVDASSTRLQWKYEDYSVFVGYGTDGRNKYCMVLVRAGATTSCSPSLPLVATLKDGTEIALAMSAPSPDWTKVAENVWTRD